MQLCWVCANQVTYNITEFTLTSLSTHYAGWFKEYSHTVHNNPHGSPEYTVYFYECYEFPGHYIHWRDGDQHYVVDCEV